jgi:hypothetical protein
LNEVFVTLLKKRSLADLLGPIHEPLDPLAMAEVLPRAWDGPHVALRLVEGFVTVLKLPMRGGPARLRSAWPPYMYEFADLAAQAEQGELERTHEQQNRVRIVPSAVEIAHMEASVYWPTQYLGADPDLREAVNMIALAHALGLDAAWVAKKRGGSADTWRMRHDAGCERIASALERDRAAVF